MSEIGKNILIPIDFKETSLVALEQSYKLAHSLDLGLVLLYVHEDPSILMGLFTPDDFEKQKARIQSKIDEVAAKAAKESGLPTIGMVKEGKIYQEIARVAEVLQSKFIIMGTSSNIEHTENGMMGANTSRVIRSAPCPVITINSKHNFNGCRSILLPLDLSQETRQKVTHALIMAKAFKAKIKVMSALWSKNNEMIINQLNFQLQQVRNFIESEGVACEAVLVESTGKEKSLVPIILRHAAEEGDIDLIIIMTQNELSLIQFFVSSSAQEIMRHSEIPVMSVIPKELGYTSIG
ncbi:MAG: universal stress protein [Bacteroidota bacterium]